MAIPGTTTASLFASMAVLSGFWWQYGQQSAYYPSETNAAVDEQHASVHHVEEINSENDVKRMPSQFGPQETDQKDSESRTVMHERLEPTSETVYEADDTNAEDAVDSAPAISANSDTRQDNVEPNAVSQFDFNFDLNAEKAAPEIAHPDAQQEPHDTSVASPDVFSFLQSAEYAVGTFIPAFDSPYWMIFFAVSIDVFLLVFGAMCCRRMCRSRSERGHSPKDGSCDRPMLPSFKPPSFSEVEQPRLHEPADDSEQEDMVADEEESGGDVKKVESTALDVTQIPSPIGKRSKSHDPADPFAFQ
jgi:hypothetical protein